MKNIITQLAMPESFEVSYQIFSMKDAVDKQELRIQKSLVKDEDIH